MAIKSGNILHDANGFVIDRIQSGGVSNLNIPEEKIYELGNYNAVATVRDIPDLSFDLESFDMSCEVEALLHGVDPSGLTGDEEFDFATTYPMDIISPFKAGNGSFAIVKGIAIPYLTLESASYKFGVKSNATQSFTLKGDSIYYIPGSPYYQVFNLVNNVLAYTTTNAPVAYTESGDTFYALSVCVKNEATGLVRRLFYGTSADGYTDTSGGVVTTVTDWYDEGYDTLHVVYGSTVAATYNATVHPSTSVKPAAIRAKDIALYVSDGAATPTLTRWAGVQSVEISRKVTLEANEELDNTHYVSQDYDVPEVSGSVVVKSVDATDLWNKIAQVANVSTTEVVGALSSVPLEMEVVVSHPDTGDPLKTFNIPDARFMIPAVQGRVQQKLETTFSWTSDGGSLSVING